MYLMRRTSLSSSSPISRDIIASSGSGAVPISNFSDTISQGRLWRTDQDDLYSGFAIKGDLAIPRGTTPTFDFPSIAVYVRSQPPIMIREFAQV